MIKGVQKGTTTMPVLRAFLLPTFRQRRTLFALCVKEAVRCVCVCVACECVWSANSYNYIQLRLEAVSTACLSSSTFIWLTAFNRKMFHQAAHPLPLGPPFRFRFHSAHNYSCIWPFFRQRIWRFGNLRKILWGSIVKFAMHILWLGWSKHFNLQHSNKTLQRQIALNK